VTRVGGAIPDNGNPASWHCVPVDAIADTPVPASGVAYVHVDYRYEDPTEPVNPFVTPGLGPANYLLDVTTG
jgi:hypothetical protein